MKKMYKKPITDNLEIQTASVVCTSPGMNNNPINGTGPDGIVSGDAPGRHRNTLIVK